VKFDDFLSSSSSYVSRLKFQESEEVLVPEIDSKVRKKNSSRSGQGENGDGYALTLYSNL
jgi:hypothetical protein